MWTRLERNWFEDAKLAPGFTPSHVTAARLRHTPSGDPMLAGALSFSNSITIEHNTLGTGVVGHMLHSRAISPVTFAATDRWFAYDQVGSVIAETDADGELSATHHADAWGNRLEAWDTGIWGGQRSGWAHNTKEIDGLTDLTYMYQRWYAPETGTFLSRAPYPPMMEHEYGFAGGNPVSFVDPDGRLWGLPLPNFPFWPDDKSDPWDWVPNWLNPPSDNEPTPCELVSEFAYETVQSTMDGLHSMGEYLSETPVGTATRFVAGVAEDTVDSVGTAHPLESGTGGIVGGAVGGGVAIARRSGPIVGTGLVAAGGMVGLAGASAAGSATVRGPIAYDEYRAWMHANGMGWAVPVHPASALGGIFGGWIFQ